MEQLTRRVFYLPHAPETDRPTLGYLRGDRLALMVDAGNSPAHAGQFLEELRRLDQPLPDDVALTHRHWDHCFGLCAVDAPALAGRATARYLQQFAAISWGEAGLLAYMEADGLREFSEPHLRLEYPDPAAIRIRQADIAFEGVMELDLGGCRCVLRTIPSPHCEDCVLMWAPEEGVVFLGDACCKKLIRGVWTDDPAGAAALYAVLEPLSFDVAVVGHDAPQPRETLLRDLRQQMGLEP